MSANRPIVTRPIKAPITYQPGRSSRRSCIAQLILLGDSRSGITSIGRLGRRQRPQLLLVGDGDPAHEPGGLDQVRLHLPERRRVQVYGQRGRPTRMAYPVYVGGLEGKALAAPAETS